MEVTPHDRETLVRCWDPGDSIYRFLFWFRPMVNFQTMPDHKIRRIYRLAKTRLYPFFRDPRDMIKIRNQIERRQSMALILLGRMTDAAMAAELASISEQDRKAGMISYRQLTMARHLWRCSEHRAEQRLMKGELPDG